METSTSTPGVELPLTGMTTAMFGPGFVVDLQGRPHGARIDHHHKDMFLVRANLTIGVVTLPIFILCQDEADRRNIERYIDTAADLCTVRVGHQPDGLVFYWIRLLGLHYPIRSTE